MSTTQKSKLKIVQNCINRPTTKELVQDDVIQEQIILDESQYKC